MVKIYLRAILKNGQDSLALFDSNRNGDINDLTTEVKAGDTIIWKLDCCSGIKSITRIYSKEKEHPVFKSDPVKRFLCKGFKLQLEKGAKGLEKYTIECILPDNNELIIDPFIRVPPPDPNK
jgi:hypothetical protein